jgi:hypothetical protein
MRLLIGSILVAIASTAFPSPTAAQDAQLRELAGSLSSQLKARGKSPVAITAFANPDYGQAFSNFIVDRLTVLLTKGNLDFDVVARDRVEEATRELNLQLSVPYDSSTFPKLGKRVGARSLIWGSFTVQAGAASVSLVAQIVDVETGRIIGGEVIQIPYTGDIKNMLIERSGVAASEPPASKRVTSAGNGETPRSFGDSGRKSFQNDFLIVDVDRVAVSRDADRVSISLTFRNRGSAEEYLRVAYRPGVSLTDSQATPWAFDSNLSSGLAYQRYSTQDLENMTRLDSNSSHTVILQFQSLRRLGLRPTWVSFSLPVQRRRGNRAENFTVGISNIPVAP